jgi:hypothetical protein
VVDEDVIVEDETPQSEKDLSSPTGVVGRRRIQHHGHEGPDVVQSSGLGVESSDEVGVEVGGEGVLRGFHRGGRRATEEALRGSHLGGQGGTQGTLALQGEGGGALALPRGRHCGLDRSEGTDERGVGGGECRGRDGVAPGWGGEGGKPRRGTAAQRQRGSDVERPETGDVGCPSMGERAADFSRGNGGVRRGAGGAQGGQHGRSGGDVVRVHRGDGAAGTVGVAAASGRGCDWAVQHCSDEGPHGRRAGDVILAAGTSSRCRDGAGERRGRGQASGRRRRTARRRPGGLAATHGHLQARQARAHERTGERTGVRALGSGGRREVGAHG